MALESGTYINSLVATNPAATDALAAADDHMRLIKSTIKNTFPNIDAAITATEDELNILDGNTAATSTTLVGADRLVVNDDGTMVQAALTDLITYLGTDLSNLGGLAYPTSDGTANQVLATDGSGTLAFANTFSLPAGLIFPYAGTAAPSGYLFCNGQTVAAATYAALYAAIANTYGGDATNFILPDLRGRVVAGVDNMGSTTSQERLTAQSGGIDGDTLGATGGLETHTLSIAEMPAHTHPFTAGVASRGFGGGGSPGSHPPSSDTTDSTGGGTAHNNVQPTIVLNYIISTGT
eukprot:GHVR01183227.1.p1 GENE.GHVR01183227.1~~GHVR01183227.1.p1  ORF type:complete len:294 (+),score=62.91 GHVR01183227.1:72-953(+)